MKRSNGIRWAASALILGLFGLNGLVRADESPTPGKQVEQSLQVGDAKIGYQLFLPSGYAEGDKDWPLILFLHGRGESNGPLSLVKKWGPPLIVESTPDFPYIVVSPQCPADDRWSSDGQQALLAALLDEVVKQYRVDADRVYLTGLSMGGYGSWTLAAAHPDRFAAVVPICGGGDPAKAAELKNLPIWVFHGDQDKAVPLERSQEMVAAIQKAGGTQVRFTTLEHIGHNSWSAAYATPELYGWLNQQSISARKEKSSKSPPR
jgi:predicted peptidase